VGALLYEAVMVYEEDKEFSLLVVLLLVEL
jgi:hypothetical protein